MKRELPSKNYKQKVSGNGNGAVGDDLDLSNNALRSEGESEYQRKTITRTFRIYEELSGSFEKLIGELNTTQTNLMNEMLKQ